MSQPYSPIRSAAPYAGTRRAACRARVWARVWAFIRAAGLASAALTWIVPAQAAAPQGEATVAGRQAIGANRKEAAASRSSHDARETNAARAELPAYGNGPLAVTAGKGTLLRLNEDATSVFVADPNVADVHVPSPRAVFVLGKKSGTTTLYVLGPNNRTLLQRAITVSRDTDALRAALAARFPNLKLSVTEGVGSLQIAGDAANAADADAVVQAVTPWLDDKEVLINRMTVARPLQVQLLVRITEVDRNVTQQLGINWQSIGNATGNWFGGVFSGRPIFTTTNGVTAANLPTNNAFSLFGAFSTAHSNLQVLIDALNEEGLLTVLAEPNLVALSGQTASFIAGGEFPIPVSQVNGAITVDFKQFGVKLDFTPTVLADNRISLKVRPEVSQIDTSVSVTTGGITVPGLSVRRADTTVELGSGQSFAIAGLLQSVTKDTVSQLPGLGSIPILGKLFSSTNYLNNKTELVIMVTPYIVQPTQAARLRSPLESLQSPANDIEYSFGRRFGHAPGDGTASSAEPRLVGAAGYVY